MPTRVMLIDNREAVRRGLESALAKRRSMEIVASTTTSRGATQKLKRLRPHVVVMRFPLPEKKSLDAVARIRRHARGAHLIVSVEDPTVTLIHHLLRTGVDGFLAEERACTDLPHAIDTLLAGGTFISPAIRRTVPVRQIDLSHKSPIERLTDRERKVFALTVQDKTISQAARQLGLRMSTVGTYRCRLMEKLGTRTTSALIKFAIRHGMV